MDHEHFMRHQHFNDDLRKSMASEVLKAMNLRAEDTVFDIGSGDGFYSNEFSKVCKAVFAIDEYEKNFENKNYENPKIRKIPQSICEWIKKNDFSQANHVFFSNSFHDMECQDEILSALSSLKKGSYLDMVEFKLTTLFGPPKSIRFSKEMLKAKVEPYGFKEANYLEFENHYFISFERV